MGDKELLQLRETFVEERSVNIRMLPNGKFGWSCVRRKKVGGKNGRKGAQQRMAMKQRLETTWCYK